MISELRGTLIPIKELHEVSTRHCSAARRHDCSAPEDAKAATSSHLFCYTFHTHWNQPGVLPPYRHEKLFREKGFCCCSTNSLLAQSPLTNHLIPVSLSITIYSLSQSHQAPHSLSTFNKALSQRITHQPKVQAESKGNFGNTTHQVSQITSQPRCGTLCTTEGSER